MNTFLLLKIKCRFAGLVLLVSFLLAFSITANAQKVRAIKVTAANAASYRDTLKQVIFGSINFPYSILPDAVITNVSSLQHYPVFPYGNIIDPAGNLDSIDQITVRAGDNQIDFPEPLQLYLFHPHNNNGKLFIYHSGHCAAIATTEDVVQNNDGMAPGSIIPGLVAQGYTVLAVPMLNYQQLAPNGYTCGFNNHDALFTDGHYANPLFPFFKPLIAALNFLGRSNYNDIYMCGLSGGGWATSIYPAIDSSISMSFPVAGSWPLAVRNVFYTGGDLEQYYPALFRDKLDYHEIYTLACLAPARKMLQINNRYDNCCFAGATPHIYYVDSVKKALEGSNGTFKFYLDETEANHTVSERALAVMLRFINNENAFLQNNLPDSLAGGSNYFYDIRNNFSLNVTPDNSTLQYSLLKAPGWLSINTATGVLNGVVPPTGIIAKPDTISFKVEDASGRFVVHNYILNKKRDAPYFFTMFNDSTTIYFLPQFSQSIQSVNPSIISSFYFNNPSLSVLSISVQNNSVIKLKLNNVPGATDSIAYNGFSQVGAITYNNGLKQENFGLTTIQLNAVKQQYAVAGMIRFNTDTNKFEYFNGAAWINLN